MAISLRQLQVFIETARNENVSRAAQVLSMSQSAASSALLELEKSHDCLLFDRVGKSLRLNSLGRGLLPMAESVLGQVADIEAYLAGHQLAPLRIAATLTIGNYLATLIVAEYMRRHPAAEIGLHVANTDAVVAGLLDFSCDLALIEGDISDPNLIVEPWLTDELVIFCAPDHPMATATAIDDQQLAAASWILRERGSGTRSLFDRVVARRLGNIRPRLELEHTEAIKRAVESGLGIGCLSRLTLRDAFRRGSLCEIPTPQFDLGRQFYFARRRQGHENAAQRSFRAICNELTADARSTADIALPLIP